MVEKTREVDYDLWVQGGVCKNSIIADLLYDSFFFFTFVELMIGIRDDHYEDRATKTSKGPGFTRRASFGVQDPHRTEY